MSHQAKTLSATVAATAVLVLIGLAGWAPPALAQTPSPAPQVQAPAPSAPVPAAQDPASGKIVEGKIQQMAGSKLTLDDGTVLVIPSSVKVPRTELKAGATVKASYEEKGGEKVATSIEVRPGMK